MEKEIKEIMSNPIQVFVIGRYGELLKKCFELEQQLEANPKDEVAILELAAYAQVVETWPVENPDTVHIMVADFQIALCNYAEASKDFEASVHSKNHLRLEIDCCTYLASRDKVKLKMKELNAVGRYVGNVPMFSIDLQIEQEQS